MGSQSANPDRSRNQDGAVCSPVSSVRGAADWEGSKGVFGSHVILDDCRSRKQATGVPGLLQQLSNPSLIGGKNTRQERSTTSRESEVLSTATLPDTDRCLSLRRLSLLLSGVNCARLHVRKSFIVSVQKTGSDGGRFFFCGIPQKVLV